MFNQMPYMMGTPYYQAIPINGLKNSSILGRGAGIFNKLSWSSILSNAQKALNVANQAIPLYYQIKPMFNNIKTISKIGKEFNKVSNVKNNNTSIKKDVVKSNDNTTYTKNYNQPTFFL